MQFAEDIGMTDSTTVTTLTYKVEDKDIAHLLRSDRTISPANSIG